MQAFHYFRIGPEEPYGLKRAGGQSGGHTHTEHEAGQIVTEIFNDALASCKVSAAGAEPFGQGAHLDVDVVGCEPEVFVNASAGLAEHAGAVGFVNHQEAAVFLLERHESGNVGNVSVHTVGSLDDY